MAGLFWHSHRRGLDPAEPLDSFRHFIGNQLSNHGFQNVNVSQADVSAVKGDTLTSIAHLPLGGGQFFEMTMTGGETGADTQAVNQEVVGILAGIANL